MLTLILLLVLIGAFYAGARRGMIVQIIRTLVAAIVMAVGFSYNSEIAEAIDLIVPYPQANFDDSFAFYSQETGFALGGVFYKGVAFLIILFLAWLLAELVSFVFRSYSSREYGGPEDIAVGGLLNFLLYYVALYFILLTLSTVPIQGLQDLLGDSFLAGGILQHTPLLSSYVASNWIQPIA